MQSGGPTGALRDPRLVDHVDDPVELPPRAAFCEPLKVNLNPDMMFVHAGCLRDGLARTGDLRRKRRLAA